MPYLSTSVQCGFLLGAVVCRRYNRQQADGIHKNNHEATSNWFQSVSGSFDRKELVAVHDFYERFGNSRLSDYWPSNATAVSSVSFLSAVSSSPSSTPLIVRRNQSKCLNNGYRIVANYLVFTRFK